MLPMKNIAALLRYLTHLWWEDVMAYVSMTTGQYSLGLHSAHQSRDCVRQLRIPSCRTIPSCCTTDSRWDLLSSPYFVGSKGYVSQELCSLWCRQYVQFYQVIFTNVYIYNMMRTHVSYNALVKLCKCAASVTTQYESTGANQMSHIYICI